MKDESAPFTAALLAAIPKLMAFAVVLCGSRDVARDLVQETLLKAWEARATFRQDAELKPWLFTILRNEYYSRCRKSKRMVEDEKGLHQRRLAVAPDQQSKLDLADFARALDELPRDQRDALILVVAEGLSYEEAAVVCQCAIGTIKSRINRARASLAKALEITSLQDLGAENVTVAVLNFMATATGSDLAQRSSNSSSG